MSQNQRNLQRFPVTLPINISFGSQITLQGQIKDLSLKSAFINIRSSIHMAQNDELNFAIEKIPNNSEGRIEGSARISRIVVGEGIAIYFIKMDEASSTCLEQLINA